MPEEDPAGKPQTPEETDAQILRLDRLRKRLLLAGAGAFALIWSAISFGSYMANRPAPPLATQVAASSPPVRQGQLFPPPEDKAPPAPAPKAETPPVPAVEKRPAPTPKVRVAAVRGPVAEARPTPRRRAKAAIVKERNTRKHAKRHEMRARRSLGIAKHPRAHRRVAAAESRPMVRRVEIRHSTGGGFACGKCGKRFRTESGRRAHFEAHHYFRCRSCGARFYTAKLLNSHRKVCVVARAARLKR